MSKLEINETPAPRLTQSKNEEASNRDLFSIRRENQQLSAGYFSPFNFGLMAMAFIILVAAQTNPRIEFWLIPLLIICSLQGVFYWIGLFLHISKPTQTEAVVKLPDDQLPAITLLIPLFNEANMMPQIHAMLCRLDYPTDRMQILVLSEMQDTSTRDAFLSLKWPQHISLFVIPIGAPQTKARACNFGLANARGSIIGVIDAEDWPHPEQLREVANGFHMAPASCACLQAPLVIKPENNKLIQSLFALEYHILFRFLLPTWIALGAPTPLSGSANFFRTSVLKKVGGWDKYNLTEDADIGIRFSRLGYSVGMLVTPSIENAPRNVRDWFWQRTRWSTGHFQTLMVHIRQPLNLFGEIGLISSVLFLASFGARVVTSIAGLVLISALAITETNMLAYLLYEPIGQLSLFAYSGRVACYIAIGILGVPFVSRTCIILLPFYWLLQIPPAILGITLATCRHFKWHKTPHEPYTP